MSYDVTIIRPGGDLSEVFEVRKKIFGFGEDDLDDISINILLKDGTVPVGCGRLTLDMEDDRVIIEQIGVAEQYRGKGISSEILNALFDIARDCECEIIWAKTRMNQAVEELMEKHGFEQLNSYWMTAEMKDVI